MEEVRDKRKAKFFISRKKDYYMLARSGKESGPGKAFIGVSEVVTCEIFWVAYRKINAVVSWKSPLQVAPKPSAREGYLARR